MFPSGACDGRVVHGWASGRWHTEEKDQSTKRAAPRVEGRLVGFDRFVRNRLTGSSEETGLPLRRRRSSAPIDHPRTKSSPESLEPSSLKLKPFAATVSFPPSFWLSLDRASVSVSLPRE